MGKAGRSVSTYRFRKMIKELESKEGRGTELISLYVPPGRPISDVVSYLRQEYGTAANIKSKTTRKNVQSALVKVMERLKLFKKVPENGLAIFCGAVAGERLGDERMEIHVIIPPEPINTFLYRCDSRFHVELLKEMVKGRGTYGILLVDTSEATYALLKGRNLEVVKRITSGIPGKHRAGGQSARRFERYREMRVQEFFRRVGEKANEIFLSVPDLKGIIVGGPGYTKRDFLKGDYLHYELAQKVVGVIDTSYTDEEGLDELISKASEILKGVRYAEEKRLVQEFLYHVGHDTGLAVYGERDVVSALKDGLVKTLLISEGLRRVEVRVRCSGCGFEMSRLMDERNVPTYEREVLEAKCPKCGNVSFSVVEKLEVADKLVGLAEEMGVEVEMISTRTQEGVMLKESFEGVGALLKYRRV